MIAMMAALVMATFWFGPAPFARAASDTYKVELKAWIPSQEVTGTAPDPEYDCGPPAIGSVYTYNGNGHKDYGGYGDHDYKTLITYDFSYNGESISDIDVQPSYGVTEVTDGLCSKNAQADHGQDVTAPADDSFSLTTSVADPMITGAPTLDAALTGKMISGDRMSLDLKSDKFPNYGFRVFKNDQLIATVVDFDASCETADGPVGLKNIAAGLTAGDRGDWHRGHHDIDLRVSDQNFFGPCGEDRPPSLQFPAT